MASRRAAALTLGAAQRGVFWQVACRSGCKNACCVAVPLARAYAAAAGGDSLAKVHPPQQSMRTAYKDTDMSHTEKWMQVSRRRRECRESQKLFFASHGSFLR